MEETYRTEGIVLGRQTFREDDLRVTFYTPDFGKLALVARGAKKLKSKLAAHVEPFCLVELMAVRGRQYDYLGSAVSRNCFANLKNDSAKLEAAGRVFRIFNQLVREKEADRELYLLSNEFITQLNLDNTASDALLADLFLFKLLVQLGYQPELYNCLLDGKPLPQGGNFFDFEKNGLICSVCSPSKYNLPVADDSVKLLRLATNESLKKLARIKLNPVIESEVHLVIDRYIKFNFQ